MANERMAATPQAVKRGHAHEPMVGANTGESHARDPHIQRIIRKQKPPTNHKSLQQITRMKLIVCVLLLAFVAVGQAALPPGYEDHVLCPPNSCKERVDSPVVGPARLNYRCRHVTGAVLAVKTWGPRTASPARLTMLMRSGYHHRTCLNGDEDDDNALGGSYDAMIANYNDEDDDALGASWTYPGPPAGYCRKHPIHCYRL